MSQQSEITRSFNEIYRKKGFRYLRPSQAYEIFVSILSPETQKKYLDVGCGLGLLLKLMVCKGLSVYGVDISEEAVKISRTYCPEATIFQANAENLPFKDKEFNYITCIGSLERMIDRTQVLKEQIRVAKDDAKFCYMVRNANHISWKFFLKPFNLYNHKAHQEAFNLEDWIHLFKSNGFRILSVFPDHWPYYRIRKSIPFWGSKINYSRIRKFPFGLTKAYEFIFLLEKDV
jgi:ubiquinone/menaquinone biosynthesis C-methylase UbiE